MTADRAEVLKMLVSGGDDRLVLDPRSGLNMYGYGAAPAPNDLTFNSSTASTISPHAFEAVCETFGKLQSEITTGDAAAIYAREMDQIRDRLRHALGVESGDADVILAASGTDLHLVVASLMRGLHDRPVLTLSLTGSETGSGVAFAASGKHAMPHPVSGRSVRKGDCLSDDAGLHAFALPVREDGGDLRSETVVAEELYRTIETAIYDGMHCVLIATDVSKTGLIAPSLDTIFALKSCFGDRLDILVDACQLRVAPETVQAYLAKGCLVAVTGSKFLAGPIFSGALLVPMSLATDLKRVPACTGLGDYSGAGDWPDNWAARNGLPKRRNFGLLLRWQAALVELEAMLTRHSLKLGWVSMAFADAVQARMKSDPRFETIPSRRLDRSALGISANHDLTPTIFPFLLRRGGKILDTDEMTTLYQELATGGTARPRVRLGQPVALGKREGRSTSALRLCLSAPLLTAACESQPALDRLIANAMLALDCAAELANSASSKVA